jgi:hypothetical protein
VTRLLGLISITALAVLALAASSASAAPDTCPVEPTAQTFAPFGDSSSYVPARGGTFEDATDWTLAGSAAIVDGNEPYFLNAPDDAHLLRLGAGDRAKSPASCLSIDRPTMRFMVHSTGSALGLLIVSVEVLDGDGVLDVLPAGVVTGLDSDWRPSAPILLAGGLLHSLDGPVQVRFRFRAVGSEARFEVDDLYIDPYGRG